MKKPQLNNKGFGLVGILVVIVVLAAVSGAGAYVYHKNHKTKAATATSNSTSSNTATKSTSNVDPYAGWKTYCDSTTQSCIKHPAEWAAVAGFPGAFENSTATGYVSLEAGTNKDRSQGSAYVVSVDKLTTTSGVLDIVGYIVNGKPGYSVYDAAYVSANGIKSGSTVDMTVGNYAFSGKIGTVSLVATPGANGYAAITTVDQAKNWFATADAKTSLLVLRSLSYN